MKVIEYAVLACVILLYVPTLKGEVITDVVESNECGKFSKQLNDMEKRFMTLKHDMEIKTERLVNRILQQTINSRDLEKMILAQNIKMRELENNIIAQAKDNLERKIDQMSTERIINESLHSEIESRERLAENQETLIEQIQTMKGTTHRIKERIYRNRNKTEIEISELLSKVNNTANIQDNVSKQQQVIETRLSTTNAELLRIKTNQEAVRGQVDKCMEEQSKLSSVVQTVVNDTAALLKHAQRQSSNQERTSHNNDCKDVQESGNSVSGVYDISIQGQCCIKVYCDMDTDGGGWTVFQRRFDGSVDFFRTWREYKSGFGDKEGEHWLGNDLIHNITSQGHYELRINLEDFESNQSHAAYRSFSVGDESSNYNLFDLGEYSGDAGDALTYHKYMMFSTKDNDNDRYRKNCAADFEGAWWYKGCYYSNLNGLYQNKKSGGNRWRGLEGFTNMKASTMMIRKI